MTITTLPYPGPDSQQGKTALDPKKHFIYCSDQKTVETVSEELCAAGETPAPLRLALDNVLHATNGGKTRDSVQELRSLIDTGGTGNDLDRVHAGLAHFVELQGRSRGPGTPLATLQARKAQLEQERQNVGKALDSACALAPDIYKARNQLEVLRAKRQTLLERLRAAAAVRTQQLQDRLKEVRNQLDGFRGKRFLDTGKAALLKRKETQVETARLQCVRTREELEETRRALNALPGQSAQINAGKVEGHLQLPVDLEHEARILATSLDKIQTGMKEAGRQVEEIGGRVGSEEHKLSMMPDFTRIAPNPADWLNQMAASLDAAILARDQEAHEVLELQNNIRVKDSAIEAERRIFSEMENLSTTLMDYHEKEEDLEEKMAEARKRMLQIQGMREKIQETQPGVGTLGLGSTFGLIFILGVYASVRKTPILYAAAVLFLAVLYFVSWFIRAYFSISELKGQLAQDQAILDQCAAELEENEQRISDLLVQAECGTIRELEARYDQYTADEDQLAQIRDILELTEESLRESDERIPLLFARIQETLAPLEEHPEQPEDVERCVSSAIRKSADYHKTVKHLANLRNQYQGLAGKRRFLEGQLAEIQKKLAPLEQALRVRIRQNGFNLESRHTEVIGLLAAYQRYVKEMGEAAKRGETLTALLKDLETRLREEEALYTEHADSLSAMLKEQGLEAFEEVEAASKNASLIADLSRERHTIEKELAELVQGQFPAFEEKSAAGPDQDPETAAINALRNELATCETDYEAILQQYQSLHAKRNKILAGWRSLPEIDEDSAASERAEAECRRHLAAGARAMALIDEITPQWRAHYGSVIRQRAETLLREAGVSAGITLDLSKSAPSEALVITAENDDGTSRAAAHLALRLASLEALACPGDSAPLIVTAPASAMAAAPDWRPFFSLLDQAAARRQVLLISDDAPLALAARASGWSTLAI
ncbi:MAG TPA: hypothetical protein PKO23_14545 [Candidatus Hydrogenedentes bacterium]|nr:hypothetical protein [Candidatus Hydrogenedentota bacterium]